MNRVLLNCMNSFLKEYSLSEKDENVKFEHFVNYCIFSKYVPEAYTEEPLFYEYVHTGSGGDCAIDGLLILVNDIPVHDIEQLNSVIGIKRQFTSKFIFVQAKTSSEFDSGEILKTGHGVLNIINDEGSNVNEKIQKKRELIREIYSNSANFEENPECYLYYVTTGKWVGDSTLVDLQCKVEENIRDLNVISEVAFIPIDAEKLQQIYRNVTHSIKKEIQLERVVAFPAIPGIDQAFLGLVQIKELLHLISDEDGVLQNALFYENVRGFLGDNSVNNEIKQTLKSQNDAVRFPVLNNGITIVAKTLNRVGDKFTLSDFQVVNGCQTCNVIYNCKNDFQTDRVFCTLKIICTENSDVIVSITKSTNRQTNVTDEAFESLRQFHKNLQQYYESISEVEHRLYYERRSREFASQEQIDRNKIVSLTTQIKSFISMFLLEPHSTHRYYGELLKSYKKKIFNDDDILELYYVAAWCLYNVDQILYRDKQFNPVRKYRYHFVMIIGLLASDRRILKLRFNSREAQRTAETICKRINDQGTFYTLMKQSCEILMRALESSPENEKTPNIRKRDFTNIILELATR